MSVSRCPETSLISGPSSESHLAEEGPANEPSPEGRRDSIAGRSTAFASELNTLESQLLNDGFVSLDDLIQLFFKLYKTLDFVAVNESLRMRYESFHVKVRAAEKNYESALLSGITTIAILGPGVLGGTYFLGRSALKWFKPNSPSTHGLIPPRPGVGLPEPVPDLARPSLSRVSRDAGPDDLQKPAVKKKDEEPAGNPSAAASSDKTSDRVDDKKSGDKNNDRRGLFQGLAMFMLPSGSSAAGELAGAEPQKESDILKALAELIDDYVRQLSDGSSSYDQGVRDLARTLSSN